MKQQSRSVAVLAPALALPIVFFFVKIVQYEIAPDFVDLHESTSSVIALVFALLASDLLRRRIQIVENTNQPVPQIDDRQLLKMLIRVASIGVGIALLLIAGTYLYLRYFSRLAAGSLS